MVLNFLLLFDGAVRVDWGNPTSRYSILMGEHLFLFSIWFNQGISPLASIIVQVTSSLPSEEASKTITQYFNDRQEGDGVIYLQIYSENMG